MRRTENRSGKNSAPKKQKGSFQLFDLKEVRAEEQEAEEKARALEREEAERQAAALKERMASMESSYSRRQTRHVSESEDSSGVQPETAEGRSSSVRRRSTSQAKRRMGETGSGENSFGTASSASSGRAAADKTAATAASRRKVSSEATATAADRRKVSSEAATAAGRRKVSSEAAATAADRRKVSSGTAASAGRQASAASSERLRQYQTQYQNSRSSAALNKTLDSSRNFTSVHSAAQNIQLQNSTRRSAPKAQLQGMDAYMAEMEAARKREEEERRQREIQRARARELDKARQQEAEIAKIREEEARKRREEEARIADELEVQRQNEEAAVRWKAEEAARVRAEAEKMREIQAQKMREEEARRVQEREVKKVREAQVARVREEEEEKIRQELARFRREEAQHTRIESMLEQSAASYETEGAALRNAEKEKAERLDAEKKEQLYSSEVPEKEPDALDDISFDIPELEEEDVILDPAEAEAALNQENGEKDLAPDVSDSEIYKTEETDNFDEDLFDEEFDEDDFDEEIPFPSDRKASYIDVREKKAPAAEPSDEELFDAEEAEVSETDPSEMTDEELYGGTDSSKRRPRHANAAWDRPRVELSDEELFDHEENLDAADDSPVNRQKNNEAEDDELLDAEAFHEESYEEEDLAEDDFDEEIPLPSKKTSSKRQSSKSFVLPSFDQIMDAEKPRERRSTQFPLPVGKLDNGEDQQIVSEEISKADGAGFAAAADSNTAASDKNFEVEEYDASGGDGQISEYKYLTAGRKIVYDNTAAGEISSDVDPTAGEASMEIESTAGEVSADIDHAAEEISADIDPTAGEISADIDSTAGEVSTDIDHAAGEASADVDIAAERISAAGPAAAEELISEETAGKSDDSAEEAEENFRNPTVHTYTDDKERNNKQPTKRHNRKKYDSMLGKIIAASLVAVMALNIILPDRESSELENRELAQIPSLTMTSFLDGSYSEKVEEWQSDQFIGRNALRNLQIYLRWLGGDREENDVYFGKDGQLLEKIETADADLLETNAAAMKEFAESYPDVRFGMMLVPDAGTILTDSYPAFADAKDQREDIAVLHSLISDNYLWVDALGVLDAHSDEKLYYKTDHHWTSLGAFYGYQGFCDTFALQSNTFSVNAISNTFNGVLASTSGYCLGEKESIEMYTPETGTETVVTYVEDGTQTATLYDEEKLKTKDQYAVFLGGNYPLLDIKTTTDTDSVLLVFKDSFANSMIPFLTTHYKEIVVVDPRYYTGDIQEIMLTYGITDCLFLYSGNTFFTDHNLQAVLGQE